MYEHQLCAPLPTIRRIPRYLRYLEDLATKQVTFVSASRIAEQLNLKPIQVRKDMAYTGIHGRPKVGYKTEELVEAIRHFLGWDRQYDAFLIGAGALGTALLGFQGFATRGLRVVAAFDSDRKKAGTLIHGIPVYPPEDLTEMAKASEVLLGIITVPPPAAQTSADLLVAAGITGIWNFSQGELKVPEHVTVQREDISAGLAVLSVRMIEKKQGTSLGIWQEK